MKRRERNSAVNDARRDAIEHGKRLLEIGKQKNWQLAPEIESRAARVCYRIARQDQKLKQEAELMAASELASIEVNQLLPVKDIGSLFESLYERSLFFLREEKFGAGWMNNPLYA